MSGALTVNDSETCRAACIAGVGLVQAPAAGLQPLIDEGVLVEVLPDYPAEPMPVSLLYAHRRHLPKRVQEFMNWMTDMLAPYVDPPAQRG